MPASSSRYPIPARVHRVEETIQRSRFITTGAHAPDAEAAHAFIQRVRDEFPDATHHCWAFVAGPPASTTHIGMSDDGEPHGTAGRPMLRSLLHGGVGEIVAVCARYFGGVKLGTGGLSRAYSGGVRLLLDSLPVEEKVERVMVEVTVTYADVDALQRLMEDADITVESEKYGAEVRYACGVPVAEFDSFRSGVADATRGAGLVREL
ncbi:MAG: YigZ family protein [Gemmatimonadota bacterium]|nr:YigZ family protein [Gemmatimonadota bacterium]